MMPLPHKPVVALCVETRNRQEFSDLLLAFRSQFEVPKKTKKSIKHDEGILDMFGVLPGTEEAP